MTLIRSLHCLRVVRGVGGIRTWGYRGLSVIPMFKYMHLLRMTRINGVGVFTTQPLDYLARIQVSDGL